MNGEIKQRDGEVWLFTSMGNFSQHGQALWKLKESSKPREGSFLPTIGY